MAVCEAERWSAFGWEVHTVAGHDPAALRQVFSGLNYASGRPHLLLARTTSGRGVSYMENQIKWHYWPMSDDEYRQALADVGAMDGA